MASPRGGAPALAGQWDKSGKMPVRERAKERAIAEEVGLAARRRLDLHNRGSDLLAMAAITPAVPSRRRND